MAYRVVVRLTLCRRTYAEQVPSLYREVFFLSWEGTVFNLRLEVLLVGLAVRQEILEETDSCKAGSVDCVGNKPESRPGGRGPGRCT